MAQLLKSDGTMTEVRPDFQATTFELHELQKLVGGYIEMLPVPGGKVMVVNEEGKLKGMPENMEASFITGQPIVGDVLIASPKEVGL